MALVYVPLSPSDKWRVPAHATPAAHAATPHKGKTSLVSLAKQTFQAWMNDKCMKLAAALACYSILSLAPLVVILFKICSVVLEGDRARRLVTSHLQSLMGTAANTEMIDAILQASQNRSGILATAISIGVLLFGASGVFGELQDSLNTIWKVKPKKSGGIIRWLRNRFVSMAMVISLGFLLLISFFVSTLLTVMSSSLLGDAKIGGFVVDILLSLLVITAMTATIYKWLPDTPIHWRDVWPGAVITAALFIAGKWGLTLYFRFAAPTSVFGAFGSLAAVIIWIYYAAQILFLGAEFTKIYARSRGHNLASPA